MSGPVSAGRSEAIIQRAIEHGMETDEFVSLAYDIAFLKGDLGEMEHQAARARGRSGGENWIAEYQTPVSVNIS
jgi:hypothetical protein